MTKVLNAATLCGLLYLSTNAGAEEPLRSGPVVAATVLNVLKFVTFPAPASAGIELCLFNERDEVAQAMRMLHGKSVHSRVLNVILLAEGSAADRCQVVFFSHYDQSIFRYKLQQLSGQPSLTISDMPNFAEAGGIVGIYSQKPRLQLTVNLVAARRAGLSIAASLLQLATVIRTEEREQEQSN